VGGKAQIKAMKTVAGTLKLDQAYYRELEAFAKFGSDLDKTTLATLDKGAKNVEILKQGQYSPLSVGKQIAIIFCGTHGLLMNVPVERVREFEEEFLDLLELKHKDLLEELRKGILKEKEEKVLEKVAREVASRYEETE
jgi:F-type H+-transporting ATPase subunit alpha